VVFAQTEEVEARLLREDSLSDEFADVLWLAERVAVIADRYSPKLSTPITIGCFPRALAIAIAY
jgi:hypothetical protein